MDADSDGEGEAGDLGELGLNDEEGMAKFLEDVIGGEIDDSMIEEFRTSDIFDDFLKELSQVNNNGGSANVSRRPSFENEREGKQNEVFDILNSKAEAAASRPQTEKCDPSLSSGTSSKKRRKLPRKYSSNMRRREESNSDSSSNCEDQPVVVRRKKKTGKDVKIRDKLKISVKPSNSGKKSKSPYNNKPEKSSKKTSTPSTSFSAIATTSNPSLKKIENQQKTNADDKTANAGAESERHERLSRQPSSQQASQRTKNCWIDLIDLIQLAEIFSNGLRSCPRIQCTPELEEEIRACEEKIKSQTRKLNQPPMLPKPKEPKSNNKKLIDLDNVRAIASACNKERSQRIESPAKNVSSSSSKAVMDTSRIRQEDSPEHPLESQTSNITITDKLKKKALNKTEERESEPPKETSELKKTYSKEAGELMKTQSKEAGGLKILHSKETDELKKTPSKEVGERIKTHSKETDELKKTPSKEVGVRMKAHSKETDELTLKKTHSNETDELKKTRSKETDELRKTPSKERDELKKTSSKESEKGDGDRKSENLVITPEKSTELLTTKESQVCQRSGSRQSTPVRENLEESKAVDVDANKTLTSIDDLPIEVFETETTTTTSFSGVNISELESLDLVAETVVPLSPKEIGAKDLPQLELIASELSPQTTKAQSEGDKVYVQGNTGKEDSNTTLDDIIANPGKRDTVDGTNARDAVADQPVEEDVDDNEDYEPHMPSDEFPIIESEDAVVVRHETSPDKVDEQHKSPSPERIVSVKKKKFIESSSDDGDNVRKDHDDTHMQLGRKKSSDEENHRSSGKKVSFERKKDTVDYRSKKFDEFQNERQRKLSEKKKEKEKSKENDALEEIFKEKTLTGSFRIPKRTTGYGKPEPRNVSTPLAVTEAPKENLQFERFRKGKEKESYREYNNDLYMGPKWSKFKGTFTGATGNNRNMDDGRVPVLLPSDEIKRSPPDPPDEPREEPEPEPAFADDPAGGDDSDDDNNNDDKNNIIKVENTNVPESITNNEIKVKQEIKEELAEFDCGDFDPTVPLTELVTTDLVAQTLDHMESVTAVHLPDTDEIKDIAVLTLMKTAWWFKKHNNDNFMTGDAYDFNKSSHSSATSESSYLATLEWNEDSDDPEFDKSKGCEWTAVDEHCGASLLTAKYRSGPGDTFKDIFQSRTSFAYTRDNLSFQVRCNICNQLVVGAVALADHVLSLPHSNKMSELSESAVSDPTVGQRKEATNSKEAATAEKDKNSERPSKSKQNGESSKKEVSVEKTRKSDGDRKEGEKGDSKEKRKDEKKNREKDKKSKRKRSKERGSSAEKSRDTDEGGEIGVTSTGLPIKIPASAMPERKRSRSRDRRSRSPHHKRNRSRSPRHKRSKSPRKKSRSPRRRRKSRSPITRIERERVPRGEINPRDIKREPEINPRDIKREPERRRSTSAERVEKFLARTNRRSRSPSNSNGRVRKRSRRSRSKSPVAVAAVMPKRDNREFHEKLALTADGKWTSEMEKRWKLMEVEEAMFLEQYGERKKLLLETPEKHEYYCEEWSLFWERRFQEIEKEGGDPENYDYIPEWKEFWSRRLKELLAKEFEDKIKEIKKHHQMDFETLQKLRCKQEPVSTPPLPVLIPHQVPPPHIILPPQPLSSPHIGVTPQPVPMPPQMVPPPQAVVSPFPGPSPKASSIRLAGGSISARSTTSDDITARSMSISDGSSHGESHKATPKKPVVPVTAGDIMSTWEKLRTGGGVKQEPTYSGAGVSTQSSLPTLIKTEAYSKAESGSIASCESESHDVHLLLRHMCSCEDQLSFLASKVQEYFYKSEEMELKKPNSTIKLLDDEEFVALLTQVHDRFMAMIRADILPSDVLRNLNHIVYSLDAMSDLPQFQKHRAKLSSAAATNVEPTVEINASVIDNSANKNPPGSSVNVPKVASTTANRSSSVNEEIVRQLAGFLIIQGRADMSGDELKQFLQLMVPLPGSQNKPATPSTPPVNPSRGSEFRRSPVGQRRVEPNNDPWGGTDRNFTKTHNVASATTVPGRFPSLPDAHMPSTDEDEYRGRGMGRGRGGGGNISSSESFGTRSPYRGRGYMGMHQGSPPYYDQDGQSPPSNNSTQNILNALDASSSVVTSMLGKSQYRKKQNLHELQKHPEISMNQLVNKEVVNEGITSKKSSSLLEPISCTSSSNEPKESSVRPQLPPGIMNMIMKEKKKQEVPEAGEILSDDDGSPYYRRRKREPQKRKKKKKKRQRARDYRHTSSDSESDSDSRRKPHRKRKHRKTSRKDENRRRSPSPIRSEKSNGSSIQLLRKVSRRNDSDIEVLEELPPSSTPSNLVQGRSLLRDRNANNENLPNHAFNWNTADVTSPVRSPSPALPLAGHFPARSSSRVSGNSHVLLSPPGSLGKRNFNWESVSDASSGIQPKKTTHSSKATPKVKKDDRITAESKKASASSSGNKKNEETGISHKPPLMSGNTSKDKANTISKPTDEKTKIAFTLTKRPEVSKVTSVSKTFWTMNDDAQSLCSISTNESTELKDSSGKPVAQTGPPQPIRKYRSSCEEKKDKDKELVKEPGEISDSNSSVSSDE
ncbi:unnamed protein product [Orchesella dallaii]|uniref:C2H2-type domain-containing protein n=1 Tax=Orchesella dallaii TaxID=48710 RepID=A0ABP1S928_9HEXA